MYGYRALDVRHRLVFIVGCLLVGSAYWVGLSGPLLLDDVPNLSDVMAWLDGQRTWQSAIVNNRSGPVGRPLSMATFVVDAALWGRDVWHYKLTNLLLHLACGATLLAVYARMVQLDTRLSRHASWLPVLLALIWLSLPIQVSSVLYVVQRMAILGALFILFGLWVYLVARIRVEQRSRGGYVLLWIIFPLLVVAGTLCKENAVLAFPLAFVLELSYFGRDRSQARPKAILAFFLATVVLPAIATLALLALRPDSLAAAYVGREFSLEERLLTQPRVMWEYVRNIFVPFGPSLGLFHDNYSKSTSLLEPWSTSVAIAGWLAVLAFAWRARRAAPAILAGIALFLVGHIIESGAFPLELYFEHRNYLPSFGLVFAAAGCVNAVSSRIVQPTPAFRAASRVFPLLLLTVYIGATHGRARVWSSAETLYAQELRYNPDSPRLRSFLAARAMNSGDLNSALSHIQASARQSSPRQRLTMELWRALAYCTTKTTPPDSVYDSLERVVSDRVESYAMVAWENLVNRAEAGDCPSLNVTRLANVGKVLLSRAENETDEQEIWRTRYNLARLLAYAGKLREAQVEAARAWQESSYNDGVGVFLFQISATIGDWHTCRQVLQRLEAARDNGDLRLAQALRVFRAAVRDRRESVN